MQRAMFVLCLLLVDFKQKKVMNGEMEHLDALRLSTKFDKLDVTRKAGRFGRIYWDFNLVFEKWDWLCPKCTEVESASSL
jgi:hypothetical protein